MYSVGWRDTKRLPVNFFFLSFIIIFVEIVINHFRLARTWDQTQDDRRGKRAEHKHKQKKKRIVKNYSKPFFFVLLSRRLCSMWMFDALSASTRIKMNGLGRRLSFASGNLFLDRQRARTRIYCTVFWQIKNLLNRKCETYFFFFTFFVLFRILLFSLCRHQVISERLCANANWKHTHTKKGAKHLKASVLRSSTN